jgi:5-methyltetrahydrofolate--homocysteine methyltransferase
MTFREKLQSDVILLDGAFGTYIQSLGLTDEDFGDKPGCMENLYFTRPDIINKIHADYYEAGSDAVETNTFGANSIKLAEYGLEDKVFEINKIAALSARESADKAQKTGAPRFVVGSMGPTGRLPSSNDPALSNISYDELKSIFQEQAKGLIAGNVDAIVVETGQDMLEMKAAVNAIKAERNEAKRDVVIMAQFTLANHGRMLLGTDPLGVMAVMDNIDVDVIGINCSAGPLEMEGAIRQLAENSKAAVSCIPNAGLPYEENGGTVFPLSPGEMGVIMRRFIEEHGVKVVGGCCGTTPEHIKAIRKEIDVSGDRLSVIGDRNVGNEKRVTKNGVFFASAYKGFELGAIERPIVVGERINTQGSRKLKSMLIEEDFDGIRELAKDQVAQGADILDVCAVLTERSNEKEDSVTIIRDLAQSVEVPVMVDSTDPDVISEAVKCYPGTTFINSVNLEDGGQKAKKIFALAVEHGGFVVNLVIDEKGMAKTVEDKMSIAGKLYDMAVNGAGLKPHQLLFDTLTFSLGTGDEEYVDAAINTFEAIKLIKKEHKGVLTVLGVSNISYGLPTAGRKVLNSAFLHHAVESGLDIAIVNPAHNIKYQDIPEEELKLADDLLFNSAENAFDSFVTYFSRKDVAVSVVSQKDDVSLPIDEKIKGCVLNRNKTKIIGYLDEALKKYTAEDIINNILLDAMRRVGEQFDSGAVVLPHVLQSAEVMKKSIDHLEQYLKKDDVRSKPKILLATVSGDVHDIGKNLVRMILENNGFTVIDLGKQVPVETIVSEAIKNKVDAVGLSALLVSTSRHMRTAIRELDKSGFDHPVLVGGAPINDRFALEIALLDEGKMYKGGVFYARDAFSGLKIMQALTDPLEKEKLYSKYNSGISKGRPEVKNNKSEKVDAVKQDNQGRSKNIPTPPFVGLRDVTNIPFDEVFKYCDEKRLFDTWGSKLKEGSDNASLPEEYGQVLKELKDESIRQGWLDLKAVYGYFNCSTEGTVMNILDENGGARESIDFAVEPSKKGTPLSAYFLPGRSGNDIVAFQAVTVGSRISEVVEELDSNGDYTRSFYLHGFSVHLAEAVASYIHDRIRKELDLKEGQGKRYSPGFFIWKDITDQKKIFKLLDIENRIGVKLTSECQMVPEQSTTAIIVYDETAVY